MIGKTLGHFEILSLLGEGGMGSVYRAHDTRLDRDVALKILPSGMVGDSERVDRFRREAKTLAALDHPNIVTIFSVESAGDTPFLTMQLVRGSSLAELLPSGGMETARLFTIAIALSDALATAHGSDIIHRDLKPANVMVTDDGRVKILDFGLAKLRSSVETEDGSQLATEPLTAVGQVMGTVPYMPPEQIKGQPTDERSDIFSLGVLLYELATGERPFQGESSPDVASAILRDTPPPINVRRPELPRDLARVVRRCLEKDPSRRYQSALDISNELLDLSSERAVEAVLESHSKAAVAAPVTRSATLRVAAMVVALGSAITAGVVLWPRSENAGLPTGQRFGSLAVLPFDNLMNDPEQDYFVDGMQEALITELSRIGELRVISRTSVMRYRDTEKTAPQIARELNVDALIEGSVLRADGLVRINAQLIDGATDEHLWAEIYDRDLTNVLTLLSEVAIAISDEIELTLTPDQRQRLAAGQDVDPAAQEAYLQGRHHINKFNGEDFQKALERAREVVEIQPDWAPGHALLGGAYLLMGSFGHMPLDEAVPGARAAALHALSLDDQSTGAHGALGWVYLYFDWNWEAAERSFLRAIELNASNFYARHGYSDLLTAMGRVEEGLEQVLRGRQSDPISLIANVPAIGHLVLARRYEEALVEGDRLRDLDESIYSGVWFAREAALWHLGRREEALALVRERYASSTRALEAMDRGYAVGGAEGAYKALAILRASDADRARRNALGLSQSFARLGEVDLAFEWLEIAVEERQAGVVIFRAHPDNDALKGDPRYDALVRRIGLPEEAPL